MGRRYKSRGYDPGEADDYRHCSVCGLSFNAGSFIGGETSGMVYTTTGTFYHPPLGAGTAYVESGYVEDAYVEDTATGAAQERDWSRATRQTVGDVPDQHKSHWFCGSNRPWDGRKASTYGRR